MKYYYAKNLSSYHVIRLDEDGKAYAETSEFCGPAELHGPGNKSEKRMPGYDTRNGKISRALIPVPDYLQRFYGVQPSLTGETS